MPNNGEVGCVHYWIIDEARGPTSHGRCKNCGAWGIFPNTVSANWHEQQKAEASIFRLSSVLVGEPKFKEVVNVHNL